MNPLYIHPIILPMSSGGGEGLDSRILVSMLIALNVLWLLAFIVALIHTVFVNKNNLYKETLRDRDYFFFISIGVTAIDVLVLFFGLSYWVSTLL